MIPLRPSSYLVTTTRKRGVYAVINMFTEALLFVGTEYSCKQKIQDLELIDHVERRLNEENEKFVRALLVPNQPNI